MGESAACLVRSFSQPSPTSEEEKKVSPNSRSISSPVLISSHLMQFYPIVQFNAFRIRFDSPFSSELCRFHVSDVSGINRINSYFPLEVVYKLDLGISS